jgi:hypothetical protein
MRGHKREEMPARFSRLEQRFAAWRQTRKRGERIPPALWKSAAKLAADYGLSRIATRLKLDYYALKKHVDRQSTDDAATAAFVALPPASMTLASECLIELEDGQGASLRVRLKGTDVPDVLALGRNFWTGQ